MAAPPVLRRIDIYVYKDKAPPGDLAQIPADQAPINFYGQGATCKDIDVQIDPGQTKTVNVYSTGSLADTNDVTLYVLGVTAGPVLKVMGNPDALGGTVQLKNNTAGTVHVKQFDRLINKSVVVTPYVDPLGGTAVTPVQTASDGRFSAYMAAFQFDYIITVAGSERIFVDAEGSYVMR